MISEKSEIRKKYKQKRASLSASEKEDRSQAIFNKLVQWLENWNSSKRVHMYFPIQKQGEVNTYPILHWFWEQGWEVYGSVVDRESDKMFTVRIPKGMEFVEDKWGIPVPQPIDKAIQASFDLILVPLLAFDQEGWRIGFGKGYYDQFLAALEFEPVKVGLSFFDSEELLPREPHDIPLNFCITPEKVIRF
ncbi:MAG: 5-formyltetrahydrofolate cyclo-ligase [Algoriphagus sp.]|uniref:5-formyltetrahydrofolate cyclo-ligase n=1 Tax=Algoriphagus sp. TaxID=1872435 RepID=UPI00179D74DB|nr:5-formyltetrahydrofolate cyclo-ligase [Algoriphagus sp.]NVJ86888.1 5-formyltetrahydrofolate cyclo-ligase [Algoriphagus sp.]